MFVGLLVAITILGPEDGTRWETPAFALLTVLFGRLWLRQNMRVGTRWRSRLYGGDDKP